MEYISGSSEHDLICMMAANIFASGQVSIKQAARIAVKLAKCAGDELAASGEK
jgi:predicted HTH domain antitoxin